MELQSGIKVVIPTSHALAMKADLGRHSMVEAESHQEVSKNIKNYCSVMYPWPVRN